MCTEPGWDGVSFPDSNPQGATFWIFDYKQWWRTRVLAIAKQYLHSMRTFSTLHSASTPASRFGDGWEAGRGQSRTAKLRWKKGCSTLHDVMPSNTHLGGLVSQDSHAHCDRLCITQPVGSGKWLPLHHWFLFPLPSLLISLYLNPWVISLVPSLFSCLHASSEWMERNKYPCGCSDAGQGQPTRMLDVYYVAILKLFHFFFVVCVCFKLPISHRLCQNLTKSQYSIYCYCLSKHQINLEIRLP